METASADCFVCGKHRDGDRAPGGVLYSDDLIYVGHRHPLDGPTVYRGWLIVETRRHVPGLADLTDDEAAAVGTMTSRLARVLRAHLDAEHVYSFVLGHGVAHFHVHVVPRHPGTPDRYRGLAVDEWPEAPQATEPEMRSLIADLTDRLG